MLKIVLSILLLTILQVNGQDTCVNIATFQGINATRYLGVWYEIDRFPIASEELLKCIKIEYSVIDPVALLVRVNNTGININTNVAEAQVGTATPTGTDLSKLQVTYNFGAIEVKYDYWIIDTDYTGHSLVYSCKVVLGKKTEYAWILSRQRTLSSTVSDRLKANLQSAGINTAPFIKTDQSC